ncbi:MAG: hypothetical protein LBG27_11045 [Spirochaetaceae bacterium]|nr:hypothetical protein [Spirochaetaceae bacterium]
MKNLGNLWTILIHVHLWLEKMDAAQWLVEATKDIGINIDGFHHVITDENTNHALDRYSNEEGDSRKKT